MKCLQNIIIYTWNAALKLPGSIAWSWLSNAPAAKNTRSCAHNFAWTIWTTIVLLWFNYLVHALLVHEERNSYKKKNIFHRFSTGVFLGPWNIAMKRCPLPFFIAFFIADFSLLSFHCLFNIMGKPYEIWLGSSFCLKPMKMPWNLQPKKYNWK